MPRLRLLVVVGLLLVGMLGAWPQHTAAQGGHEHKPAPAGSAWPFAGDKLASAALIKATADTLGIKPRQVQAQLKAGKSIATIAGGQRDQVLAAYNSRIDQLFDGQIKNGKLPQSVADSRRAWHKRTATLILDLPGLRPAFPGLHELHVVMISAGVEATGLRRATIRTQLEACSTLAVIATGQQKTAADVTNAALANLDPRLDQLVASGKLTAAQRTIWRTALAESINKMVTTPGLHVAGKACAK